DPPRRRHRRPPARQRPLPQRLLSNRRRFHLAASKNSYPRGCRMKRLDLSGPNYTQIDLHCPNAASNIPAHHRSLARPSPEGELVSTQDYTRWRQAPLRDLNERVLFSAVRRGALLRLPPDRRAVTTRVGAAGQDAALAVDLDDLRMPGALLPLPADLQLMSGRVQLIQHRLAEA